MNNPNDLQYTDSHEWVRLEEEMATIGITAHAADNLSDLVFLELPEVGTEVTAGEAFGEIESVKAVADLKSPVNGTIVETNEGLADALELVNNAPYEDGWMIKVQLSGTPDTLLDAASYDALVASET
ncbi:MAG: glycine cleavage system protein GcvH [Planctomycetota bacterium]|nr:glycine cleavage system protein GcvH [Planctomycetota bacterium]